MLDWQRYDEQFGVCLDRGDVYHAMQIACLYNAHRESMSPARSADEFLLWNRPDPLEADEEQEAFVARIRGMVRKE